MAAAYSDGDLSAVILVQLIAHFGAHFGTDGRLEKSHGSAVIR